MALASLKDRSISWYFDLRYLPYRTTVRLRQRAGLFCTLGEAVSSSKYEETSRQEMNDLWFDARLSFLTTFKRTVLKTTRRYASRCFHSVWRASAFWRWLIYENCFETTKTLCLWEFSQRLSAFHNYALVHQMYFRSPWWQGKSSGGSVFDIKTEVAISIHVYTILVVQEEDRMLLFF